MLTLFIIFVLSLETFLAAGLLALCICFPELRAILQRQKITIAIWLGFFILANLLTLLATVCPLTPTVGVAVLIITFCSLYFVQDARKAWVDVHCTHELRPFLIPLMVIMTLISIYGMGNSDCGDTGNYHFQAVKWLSEYGLVPGLAHLQHRLGFQSIWYALPAVFNHGFLENKVQGIAGGLGYLLFLVPALLSISAIAFGRSRASDYVFAVAMLIVWPFRIFEPVSISPNLGLILGPTLLAWMIAEAQSAKDETLRKAWSGILLLAASGLVGIRTIAAPFFLLISSFWIKPSLLKYLAHFKRSFLFLTFIFPSLISATILSGFPLYPSSALNLGLPWSINAVEARRAAQIVKDYWWCGELKTCDQSFKVQLTSWAGHNEAIILLIAIIFVSLAVNRKRLNREHLPPYFLSGLLLVTSLILYIAPGATLITGWLCLVPLILYLPSSHKIFLLSFSAINLLAPLFFTRFYWISFSLYSLIAIASIANLQIVRELSARVSSSTLVIVSVTSFLLAFGMDLRLTRVPPTPSHLFIPSVIFPIEYCNFANMRYGDLEIFLAKRSAGTKCQCWQHELPCTLEQPATPLKLRDPSCGLGCGFSAN